MASSSAKSIDQSASESQSLGKRSSVESYIYWRDPKSSGIVFGAGLILLFSLAYCSLICVICNICLAILAFSTVLRLYNDFLKFVQKEKGTSNFSAGFLKCEVLSREKVHGVIDVVIVHVNAFLIELRRLLVIEDIIESSKFALMLWVLRYIGTWFNGLTILIIAFVSLFTLPKIYENNKPQIDQHLALIRSQVKIVTKRVHDSILSILPRKENKKE